MRDRAGVVGACAWGALVAIAIVWGFAVRAGPVNIKVRSAPLYGTFQPRGAAWVVVLVVLAGLLLWSEPMGRRLSWGWLLAASFCASAVWVVALASLDWPSGLIGTLLHRPDYLYSLPEVGGDPIGFLRGFTDSIAQYSIHVQGHPPGTLMLLWAMDRAGLRGAGPAAVLFIAAGASATPVALHVLRRIADEGIARAAAPFVALAPSAIWISTSADALYLGVGAWGIGLIVAATHRTGASRTAWALASGVVLGLGLHMSYGLVPLGAVVLGVVVRRGDRSGWVRTLVPAAVGVLAVGLVSGAAGFWWPDGLLATRERYFAGVASVRPYGYSLVANLAAFGIACGPAVAAGLARLRDRRVWMVAGPAVAAVVAANLSGMSRFEVERIWLPFTIWVLVACCAIGPHRRAWLGAQLATAIAVQALVYG